MALFRIPTSQQFPWYSLPITLSGTPFTLNIRYNTRMQRWLLDILSQVEAPILLGIPLLINRDLLGQYATLSIPAGTMFCVDDTGAELEPVLSSFLVSHTLYFFDAQD